MRSFLNFLFLVLLMATRKKKPQKQKSKQENKENKIKEKQGQWVMDQLEKKPHAVNYLKEATKITAFHTGSGWRSFAVFQKS